MWSNAPTPFEVGPFNLSYILKDVMKLFPSIPSSFPPSFPSSICGWHHIIILYNVKAEKLL
jgi:hypothetical protein